MVHILARWVVMGCGCRVTGEHEVSELERVYAESELVVSFQTRRIAAEDSPLLAKWMVRRGRLLCDDICVCVCVCVCVSLVTRLIICYTHLS